MKEKIKKFIWIHLQTTKIRYQNRIKNEIDVSLEIILNVLKCLTLSIVPLTSLLWK